ncbi:hypothetical protein JCGZ_23915 [Jatropha curcas]|uniref:E3 ubiquitin-protein ligase ARIH1-like UBA-like domain-containing protein n=1 Tax=Jatropha curcas TaxID=180498 RepID=A0A067L6U9_JATCU|nr:hypothetical protein JCGZ_23915 [Jatropha curcas]
MDYYFSDDNAEEFDNHQNDPDDDYFPEIIDDRPEQNYTILKEAEIKQRQEDDITEISNVLSVNRNAASILLCHYRWIVSEVLDNWFANEEEVRKSVGLPKVWILPFFIL